MANRKLSKNIVLNVTKTILQIIFPIITVPYVTRTLHTHSYGMVNFATSIVSYFQLFAAAGISTYAVRTGAKYRDEPQKLSDFKNQVFSINLILTFISYIALALCLIFMSRLSNYRSLIIVLSIQIIFTTIGAEWVNNIYEDFFSLTVRYIITQIVSLILLFLLVHSENDYLIYALITVLSTSGALLLNSFYIRKYGHFKLTFHHLRQHAIPLAIFFVNQLAIQIYVSSDTTILGLLKGDHDVAIYSFATKLYTAVKNVFYAVLMVLLPYVSRKIKKEEDLKIHSKEISSLLDIIIMFVFPAIVGMIGVSRSLVVTFSGEEYYMAYQPLIILSIAIILSVIAGYMSVTVFLPINQEKVGLIITIISAIVNIVLNFILIPKWTYNAAALTTVIAEGLGAVMYLILSKKYLSIKPSIRVILSTAIGCVIIIVICNAMQGYFGIGIKALLSAVVLSVLAYGLILLVFNRKLIKQVFRGSRSK